MRDIIFMAIMKLWFVFHHSASTEQLRKWLFAKLQAIHAILCCITGIKIRDLKNKVALLSFIFKNNF